MEALPIDILLTIFDHLDYASKAAFSLCSKLYFNILNGQQIFSQLRDERWQLRSFLECLERDLPIELLFCPTCLRFHRISNLSEYTGLSPIYLKHYHFDNDTRGIKSWWPCLQADWRNEIFLFYGPGLNFYPARMALKLHRAKHPSAKEFLQSLDVLKHQTKNGYAFFRRQMHVVPAEDEQPSQLFMRIQQWWLVSKHDLKDEQELIGEGRQDPLLCYHRTDPYVEFNGRRAACTVQASKIVRAVDAAVDEEGKIRPRGSSGYTRTKGGGTYRDIHPFHVKQEEPVAEFSPDHEHSVLDHCFKCSTDFRLDAIRLPKSSRPTISFFDRSRDYAIILTKWMTLGTLSAQNSKEWQGHGYTKAGENLVRTSECPRNGELMRKFEGQSRYRPEWTETLEAQWKDELKRLKREERKSLEKSKQRDNE